MSMPPELIYIGSVFLSILVGFFMGYGLVHTQVTLLHRELQAMRGDLQQREKLLSTRATREHKLLSSLMDRMDIPLDGGKNRVLDRSPRAIAELLRKRREENERQWQEVNKEITP